jgi:hypothetical protein
VIFHRLFYCGAQSGFCGIEASFDLYSINILIHNDRGLPGFTIKVPRELRASDTKAAEQNSCGLFFMIKLLPDPPASANDRQQKRLRPK